MKGKKLKLKPSARDKRRYFLVNASNEKIEKAILEYLGVLGFARAAYSQVASRKSQVASQKYIIGSCLVKSLGDVRAALALAGIKIEKVSGTIKGLGLSVEQ